MSEDKSKYILTFSASKVGFTNIQSTRKSKCLV